MDELSKIFSQDYNTLYEDWDDQNYVVNGDTPVRLFGNLKIWELAGFFLISVMSLVLVIFLRLSLGKNDLDDLENLYKYSKTVRSLRETDKKIFHITKQVCFLTSELKKSKKMALESKPKKEVVLIPEAKSILNLFQNDPSSSPLSRMSGRSSSSKSSMNLSSKSPCKLSDIRVDPVGTCISL
ncbi:hypothetical protein BpHYR1_037090 [Brachionus plicatilis]|uniref:Uncharacterized protein n=1 Tax=Brachionus plicatilis TaxID=10195 RepID=A0A3M7SBJ1_BRAPC|nr:hypothetical protein BpHYR1_037090 [Brachionus plicatilis]